MTREEHIAMCLRAGLGPDAVEYVAPEDWTSAEGELPEPDLRAEKIAQDARIDDGELRRERARRSLDREIWG